MKNSSDTIGNRTRDLPTCSAVPQPTAPRCALKRRTCKTLISPALCCDTVTWTEQVLRALESIMLKGLCGHKGPRAIDVLEKFIVFAEC